MLTLPRADAGFHPGRWCAWLFGPIEALIKGAVVTCPQCLLAMSVGGERFGSVHAIDDDGRVSPSLVCPRCSWHVFVKLESWQP